MRERLGARRWDRVAAVPGIRGSAVTSLDVRVIAGDHQAMARASDGMLVGGIGALVGAVLMMFGQDGITTTNAGRGRIGL